MQDQGHLDYLEVPVISEINFVNSLEPVYTIKRQTSKATREENFLESGLIDQGLID